MEQRWRESDGVYGLLIEDYGDDLRHVWRAFSAEGASGDDADVLDVRPGTPLIVRDGLTADPDGAPLLRVRRRARPDRVRYVVAYDAPDGP